MKSIVFFLLVAALCAGAGAAEIPTPFPGLTAVYLRPEILSVDAATSYMRDIKSWGASEVFLETQFSDTLNLSKVFPPKDPERDWFEVLVKAAQAEGLKVHAWVKVAYWAYGEENLEQFAILKQHPEWIDVNIRGEKTTPGGPECQYIFVNLAIPEVVDSVLAFISELAAYEISGISIDYIRFKTAGDDPSSWYGFNPYSVEQFMAQTGVDPRNIRKDVTPGSDFMKWVKWNEQIVEDCVRRIHEHLAGINARENRNIVLSASPFTGYVSGMSPKFQDWKSWDEKHYIDLWLPMCMSLDMGALAQEIAGVKALGLKAPYYPIVYPGKHGMVHPPLKAHHDVLRQSGVQKYAAFSYKQVKEEMP